MKSVREPEKQDYLGLNPSYIERVPEGDVFKLLWEQNQRLRPRFENLTPDQQGFRYAPEKWSVKEVFGHMADVERTFAFRAFAVARGEQAELPGMDEAQYAGHAAHETLALELLLAEFYHLRLSNYYLYTSLSPESLSRKGRANGYQVSVSALIYASYGHVEHHLELLQQRYGI